MKPSPPRLGLALGAAACACAVGACGEDPGVLGTAASGSGGDSGAPASPPFLLGADVSSVPQATAAGATYFDDDGSAKDILSLLSAHGFNYVRLRTFVDPTQPAPNPDGGTTFQPYSSQGFCDLPHTVAFARQVKAAGLGFLLDFHYSDTWADPGKQIKPSAWVSGNLTTLTAALHDYTENAISTLVQAGARPDLVQLGNDITPGIELTPGTAWGSTMNWVDLGQLLRAGISAVHTVDSTIPIMLHIDRCADANATIAWVNGALGSGVAFDVLGESCYTAYQGQPGGWQTTFDTLASTFPSLKLVMAQYNADTTDPSEIRQANDIVFRLPNHQGLGTFFWEPTESGAWGPGLFSAAGNRFSTVPASIDQFDAMKTAYGL